MSMSIEELQAAVEGILDREAILDCIHRYARGMDRFDRELAISAFHPDAIDDHGKFVGNREEFWEWGFKQHTDAHLSTQHCIFNHRCELDGATAHAETYFMFVSMNRHGKPLTMGGGRYIDRFEKRAGVWGIVNRICLRDWSMMDERPDMNDLSSFTSTRALLSNEVRAFMNGGVGPKRDRTDPSYQRPLRVDPQRVLDYKKLPR